MWESGSRAKVAVCNFTRTGGIYLFKQRRHIVPHQGVFNKHLDDDSGTKMGEG